MNMGNIIKVTLRFFIRGKGCGNAPAHQGAAMARVDLVAREATDRSSS